LGILPERGKRRVEGAALCEQAGEIARLAPEQRTRLEQITDALLRPKSRRQKSQVASKIRIS
jgi:hypothetical protein